MNDFEITIDKTYGTFGNVEVKFKDNIYKFTWNLGTQGSFIFNHSTDTPECVIRDIERLYLIN